jgi:energy-coupling factor transporter transmembrane protein EcfT
MTLRNSGQPRGFFRLVVPLVSSAMRRANTQDLSRLKRLLEADPALG